MKNFNKINLNQENIAPLIRKNLNLLSETVHNNSQQELNDSLLFSINNTNLFDSNIKEEVEEEEVEKLDETQLAMDKSFNKLCSKKSKRNLKRLQFIKHKFLFLLLLYYL